MFSLSSNPVLAITGASSNNQEEWLGESESASVTQPHYRFTRQPVKYHRNHNAGMRLYNLNHATRPPATPARDQSGSADSSRSSSPEPRTHRFPQDVTSEGCQPNQVGNAEENKMNVPLSPREVVQYMLGLDSTFPSVATATPSSVTQESSQEPVAGNQTDLNIHPSNDKQSGLRRAVCHSPRTVRVEHNLVSPAQKILSGLKLRRSHSGKDEQLFV